MARRSIPLHSIGRIITDETELRVSQDAKLALKNHIESLTKEIAKKSILFAKHAKRKTVLRDDIKLAIDEIKP